MAATGDGLKATKAIAAAVWAAVIGFVAPGVSYLLGVDANGITGSEVVHALLLSVAFAGGGAAAAGLTVHRVENRRKSGEIDLTV